MVTAGKRSTSKGRRRGGVNAKKAIAARVDVSDVLAAMETRNRNRALAGVADLEDAKDEDLFVIDKTPVHDVRKALKKELKSQANLKPNAKVPTPGSTLRKPSVRKGKSRAEELKIERLAAALARKEAEAAELAAKRAERGEHYDLWGAAAEPKKLSIRAAKAKMAKEIGAWEGQIAKRPQREKTSVLSNVQVPHPGQSYNPSHEAHQDLLRQLHMAEAVKKADMDEATVKLSYRPGMEHVASADDPLGINEEVDYGRKLREEAIDSDEDEDELASDETIASRSTASGATALLTTSRAARQKTRADRNRMKRHREELKKMSAAQLEKRLLKQVNNLPTTIKGLKKELRAQQARREARKKKEADMAHMPKKLGKRRAELHTDYLLTDQVPDSLRQLPTGEANAVKDAFNNFERRNLIEARKPKVMKRRYKVPTYEKVGRGERARRTHAQAMFAKGKGGFTFMDTL